MTELRTKGLQPTREPRPTCLDSSAAGAGGFVFHLKGGIKMFAHHSFLMRIEMKSDNEICFYYTYGVVRVIGRKIETIYNLAVPHVLGGVKLSSPDDPCRDEIEVTGIEFTETTSDTF